MALPDRPCPRGGAVSGTGGRDLRPHVGKYGPGSDAPLTLLVADGHVHLTCTPDAARHLSDHLAWPDLAERLYDAAALAERAGYHRPRGSS